MTERIKKKLSRRDALKILGAAAGASVLANLPSNWSTPEITSGVLPAHAQTSCVWSLGLEITALDNLFQLFPVSVPATATVGNGGLGSAWYWECQTGCLYVRMRTVGGGGVVHVTTRTNDFDLVFTAADNFKQLLVNLGTGDYSTDPNVPVGGCEWPR